MIRALGVGACRFNKRSISKSIPAAAKQTSTEEGMSPPGVTTAPAIPKDRTETEASFDAVFTENNAEGREAGSEKQGMNPTVGAATRP